MNEEKITNNVINWLENQGKIAEKKIASFKSKTESKWDADGNYKRIPIDGILHRIYTRLNCIIVDEIDNSIEDEGGMNTWDVRLANDPYIEGYANPNINVSFKWELFTKEIKSKIKKNSNTSLNHEIKHRYKFILNKLINLEKKLPGFGPNNICRNKGLIEDYHKLFEMTHAFDELGVHDATFKHFKINRDLDDPSLEAWDGFVKKNGNKLFNISNFIMPLKKDFYEFVIKERNKKEEENEEREKDSLERERAKVAELGKPQTISNIFAFIIFLVALLFLIKTWVWLGEL